MAWHSWTHNALHNCFCFAHGSGVDSIHNIVCGIRVLANHSRASPVRRVQGNDPLKSTEGHYLKQSRSPSLMWTDCSNQHWLRDAGKTVSHQHTKTKTRHLCKFVDSGQVVTKLRRMFRPSDWLYVYLILCSGRSVHVCWHSPLKLNACEKAPD